MKVKAYKISNIVTDESIISFGNTVKEQKKRAYSLLYLIDEYTDIRVKRVKEFDKYYNEFKDQKYIDIDSEQGQKVYRNHYLHMEDGGMCDYCVKANMIRFLNLSFLMLK